MGREISLFADFSENENHITNYCGLMFKMIYEESPNAFEAVINNLLEERTITVSPQFTQQEKRVNSIPDLCIKQTSFEIFFETKVTDWFHSKQLEGHIKAFEESNAEKKILFLLCDEIVENFENRFSQVIKRAKENKITLQPITFHLLLETLKSDSVKTSNTYDNILSEFERFLETKGLLPDWMYRLDVVNCGATMNEIESGFYACPDTGRNYKHKRAKYFGVYRDKTVSIISEIRANVILEYDIDSESIKGNSIKWKNTEEDDRILIEEAIEKLMHAEKWRLDEVKGVNLQIFLLSNKSDTSFKKDTPGGMFGSKQYFEGIPKKIKTAEDLAKALNGKEWKDWSIFKGN